MSSGWAAARSPARRRPAGCRPLRAPPTAAAAGRPPWRWVTRQLVSSLVSPSTRLLSHQCKEPARRPLFAASTNTLVAFAGITLTGGNRVVTKADRMEVFRADFNSLCMTCADRTVPPHPTLMSR